MEVLNSDPTQETAFEGQFHMEADITQPEQTPRKVALAVVQLDYQITHDLVKMLTDIRFEKQREGCHSYVTHAIARIHPQALVRKPVQAASQ